MQYDLCPCNMVAIVSSAILDNLGYMDSVKNSNNI